MRGIIIFSIMGSIVVVRVVMEHGFMRVTVVGIDLLSGLGKITFVFFGRDWGLKGGGGGGFFLKYWTSVSYP